ncbi:histidine kinase [Neobacillus niacini]|uniref:sensor histidine kinase n=1 Tax=Neobacillus niacini TaxID=86668 RepID=UPI0007AB4F9F|nr:sensor histidine kinase [Neobacillus niacini]MEC1525832.1 histidine kinase [Neobacillus niacini]
MKLQIKNTLQNKMIVFFSLIFFTVILLVGFTMMQFVNQNFQEHSYQNLKSMVESNLELLDSNFARLQSLAHVIASDPDVRAAVDYRNQTDEIDYSIELHNQRNVHDTLQQLKLMPYIRNAVIVGSNDEGIYSYKGNMKEKYDFGDQEWYRHFQKNIAFSNSYFTDFHNTDYLLSSKSEKTISMVTPIQNTASYKPTESSYLISDVDLSSILLKNMGDNDVELAIYNHTGWLHLPELVDISDKQIAHIKEKIEDGEEYFFIEGGNWNDYDQLVVMKTSSITGWNVVGIKSLKSIYDFKVAALLFLVTLLFLSGIIIAIVSGLISKTILNPVNLLIGKFNRIADGDYSVTFEENSSEEIQKLSKTAEYMIHNMLALSDEVLLEQKKLAKEQMRVLQHQINPHFLNNVLQSIKAYTVDGNLEKISRLSTLLGRMLTYSVYQPYEKVKIKTELSYIEQYISIQNIRFDDKIFYSIMCNPELECVMVPKLIIQPIVENAIEHGFRNKASGLLHITVDREEVDLTIMITDNGDGMEAERVQQLHEDLKYRDSYTAEKSIGLLNVDKRIKSEYGEEYGLRIYSKKHGGTSVIITIPMRIEG